MASIYSLMANTGWPLEKAMEIWGVPETDRSKYADLLQEQQQGLQKTNTQTKAALSPIGATPLFKHPDR